MGKFKDKNGHSRWAEARSDIGTFIDKHGEKAGPVLRALIKVAVPRAGAVIDAIAEVRDSKMSALAKDKTIEHLTGILDDLDGDGMPDIIQNIPNDFALKKYITPLLIVLSALNYIHLQILELYQIREVPAHMMEMASGMLWSSIGLWQAGRILTGRETIKKMQ